MRSVTLGLFQSQTVKENQFWQKALWERHTFYVKPSDYELAVLSTHMYQPDVAEGSSVLIPEKELFRSHELPDWMVAETIQEEGTGLFARLYVNHKTQQVVLSYCGTRPPKSILDAITYLFKPLAYFFPQQAQRSHNAAQDISEDRRGIFLGEVTNRQASALVTALDKLYELADRTGYHASLTGHSLGAWTVSLACFKAQYVDERHIPAVTFDNPGALTHIEVRPESW